MEKKITSIVPSSLAVISNLEKINSTLKGTISPLLATLDVESLFTNINQQKLLDIINSLLIE
jgi:hypothetical protein